MENQRILFCVGSILIMNRFATAADLYYYLYIGLFMQPRAGVNPPN